MEQDDQQHMIDDVGGDVARAESDLAAALAERRKAEELRDEAVRVLETVRVQVQPVLYDTCQGGISKQMHVTASKRVRRASGEGKALRGTSSPSPVLPCVCLSVPTAFEGASTGTFPAAKCII